MSQKLQGLQEVDQILHLLRRESKKHKSAGVILQGENEGALYET